MFLLLRVFVAGVFGGSGIAGLFALDASAAARLTSACSCCAAPVMRRARQESRRAERRTECQVARRAARELAIIPRRLARERQRVWSPVARELNFSAFHLRRAQQKKEKLGAALIVRNGRDVSVLGDDSFAGANRKNIRRRWSHTFVAQLGPAVRPGQAALAGAKTSGGDRR